jgi:hypothetical protein
VELSSQAATSRRFPSFSYLSYFAKTEGSGEVPPIDLKTRLAGRLALPITGPKAFRAEPAGGDPCIDGAKTARKETAAGAQTVADVINFVYPFY